MPYRLGKVKPWVSSAADEFGDLFHLKNIGGWRSKGSVPNSDHPKGLALDLMTSDKHLGTSIAQYAQANAKRLGITYVIWDRHWWQAGHPVTDWKPYHGPSPHTDHVHVSFATTAPTGGGGGGGPIGVPVGAPGQLVGLADAIGGVATGIGKVADSAKLVGNLADKAMWLAMPTSVVRMVSGVFGVFFLLVGVSYLVREVRK